MSPPVAPKHYFLLRQNITFYCVKTSTYIYVKRLCELIRTQGEKIPFLVFNITKFRGISSGTSLGVKKFERRIISIVLQAINYA